MPMRYPVMWVPLFTDGTEKEREFSLFALREMLESLVRVNVGWIATHRRDFKPLYQTGVRYAPEQGTEDWLSIPEVIAAVKSGKPVDCEDLAAYRAAELRMGYSRRLGPVHAIADIRGRVIDGNKVRMHAFVRFPDGSVEDPSTNLGMPGGGAVAWEKKYPPKVVAAAQRAKRQRAQMGAGLVQRQRLLLAGVL